MVGHPGHRTAASLTADDPVEDEITLFVPQRVKMTRYRWRGYSIPTPWAKAAAA